jgi:hypothetical protein
MVPFHRHYGARPGHLALLLACFALAGYAASFLLGDPALLTVLVWFVGAAVVHDLVLFPLYSGADRLLTTALARLPHPRVPLVNHVRIPALGAGLTLLLFLPGIIRQGGATHLAATGLDQQPYLGRWLSGRSWCCSPSPRWSTACGCCSPGGPPVTLRPGPARRDGRNIGRGRGVVSRASVGWAAPGIREPRHELTGRTSVGQRR